jgi:hypothetical protein
LINYANSAPALGRGVCSAIGNCVVRPAAPDIVVALVEILAELDGPALDQHGLVHEKNRQWRRQRATV